MISFDLGKMPTEELTSYDDMMVNTRLRIENIAKLSVQLWSAVLKELGVRKVITLVSGSYDDPGNALIHRSYTTV